MLSSLPPTPLTLPLPLCCSGCNWPCQTDLFSWVLFLLYCPYLPPPQVSSFSLCLSLSFLNFNLRVSLTSSPCFSRPMCFSWHYCLYIFFTTCEKRWIKFPLKFWPCQTVVLNFNLLIFLLKKKALRISRFIIIQLLSIHN